MARLTWLQAVYQLIFRTVDSKCQCAALERLYNNVLIMSPGGGGGGGLFWGLVGGGGGGGGGGAYSRLGAY